MSNDLLLGWVEPKDRTQEQNDIHAEIMDAMPKLAMPPNVFGGTPPKGTKVLLTDLWKHPRVVDALGYPFPGLRQLTGSCVGVGGGNTIFTTTCVDAIKNNEPERIVIPFWLFNYGRSRQLGGFRGEGEGSFGSTFADSATKDGSCDLLHESLRLPQPRNAGQLTWSREIEFDWSDGRKANEEIRSEAIKHPIRTTTPLSSGGAVRDAILNFYGVTRAFGTFVEPKTGRVRGDVLVGNYNGRGGHQESWIGYWHHPNLGELIFEMNQWGDDVYGHDPGGGAAGGLWIPLDEVDRQCQGRYAEIFAFSQYEGYPAQPELFDWDRNSFFT